MQGPAGPAGPAGPSVGPVAPGLVEAPCDGVGEICEGGWQDVNSATSPTWGAPCDGLGEICEGGWRDLNLPAVTFNSPNAIPNAILNTPYSDEALETMLNEN